jgi:hypothetical protein
VKDDLGVRVGVETVATALKLLTERRKVVDFSVEDDPKALVFIVNRLPSPGKVNDAQAPHAQPYRAAGINPLVVGTSVDNGLAHPPDFGGINDVALPTDNAGYSAH